MHTFEVRMQVYWMHSCMFKKQLRPLPFLKETLSLTSNGASCAHMHQLP